MSTTPTCYCRAMLASCEELRRWEIWFARSTTRICEQNNDLSNGVASRQLVTTSVRRADRNQFCQRDVGMPPLRRPDD